MSHPYQDPRLDIETRVADLLGRMTAAEKYAQMHAFWLVLSADGRHVERTDVIDAMMGPARDAGVAARLKNGIGQITRPLGTHVVDPVEGVRARNRLQRDLLEQSRLGIPALFHEECLVGLMCQGATLFPSPLNLAATWDPALVEQAAAAIGDEARSVGCQQGLAPVLDVSRDVRWGRTEETFGEDPWLVGLLAVAYVRGLQGNNRDLLATLKHYAGHSCSEGARNHAPVQLGFHELNDIFLLPFEMAVKLAHAGAVMPAYHDIDGKPCHCDPSLLTRILREQWRFDGLIVADYAGISLLHQQHGVSHGPAESAALAFNAGLDIELPKDDCARHLGEAVAAGLIEPHKIDEIVARILREKFRLGLFEHPYADERRIDLQNAHARQLARQLATRSITVLENNGVLPLRPGDGRRIAVIGPTADDPLALLSGYSFPVHLIISTMTTQTGQIITPLQALRQCYGHRQIQYARGCDILKQRIAGAPVFPGDTGKQTGTSLVSQDVSQFPAARQLAAASDVAIVFVGDLSGLFQSGTVGEGSDTDSLRLPGVQQALLETVVATGTPTIVVMTGGRPYPLAGLENQVAALVMAFEPGQEGGNAIADVLSGREEPTGRLPLSVPKSAGAMPYFYDHKLKSAGSPVAFHFGSRYPFGHGRSWTHFDYAGLCLDQGPIPLENGVVTARIRVRNSGQVAGSEVVQLYVRDQVASRVRPVHELKAFQRIRLQPGQSAMLTFSVPTDMLNLTDDQGRRVVEPGEFEIQIGASSTDIRARGTVHVDGEHPQVLPRMWRMTSQCRTEWIQCGQTGAEP